MSLFVGGTDEISVLLQDVKSAAGDLLDKADAKKTEAEKQFKA